MMMKIKIINNDNNNNYNNNCNDNNNTNDNIIKIRKKRRNLQTIHSAQSVIKMYWVSKFFMKD